MSELNDNVKLISGVDRIASERKRQIDSIGWTLSYDDQWKCNELSRAAIIYAHLSQSEESHDDPLCLGWPWEIGWYKPYEEGSNTRVDRVRCLEKAGALIAAEIDRLNRLNSTSHNANGEKNG